MTRDELMAALRDALYTDTQAGHMLPWKEVAALADALHRRIAALAPEGATPAPDAIVTRRTAFRCPECGPCGVDEDGCCSTCGADAEVKAAAAPAPQPATCGIDWDYERSRCAFPGRSTAAAPAPAAGDAERLRDCTCLGSCRGAEGLSPRYRCALTPKGGA